MIPLSPRCEILRDKAVNEKPLNARICGQREFYFTKGLSEVPAEKRNNPYLIASGIASIILHAPAIIQEEELIVGYNYGDGNDEWLSMNKEQATEQLKQGLFLMKTLNGTLLIKMRRMGICK